MGNPGRKRNIGVEREPNGRASRSKAKAQENEAIRRRAIDVATQRVRDGLSHIIGDAARPECSSPLMALHIGGHITDEQKIAADEYASLIKRSRRATNAPRPSPRPAMFDTPGGGGTDDPDLDAADKEALKILAAIQAKLTTRELDILLNHVDAGDRLRQVAAALSTLEALKQALDIIGEQTGVKKPQTKVSSKNSIAA